VLSSRPLTGRPRVRLLEAAANSPSLTLCDGGGDGGGPTVAVPDDGTSTTVDVGDGVVLT
jgi:hypothetical protein